MAILLVKLPDKLEVYGLLLLLPVISNFYSSWCALIWHTNSKIRKLTIVVLSIFFLLSCAMIAFSFASDFTNKLTLIGGVCALIVSIISSLMIKKEKKIISEVSDPKPIIDQEYKV
jgi:D-alanyl-lipoteichoic acid acyltransferase DltB (MBOAT superfamily)